MSGLFSARELARLREMAAWEGEDNSRADWTPTLDALERGFDARTAPLFGPGEPSVPATVSFEPMWNAAAADCRFDGEVFLPGAFSSWREAFLLAARDVWFAPASDALRELAGGMRADWREWIERDALPVVRSGAHFRAMALKYPVLARQAARLTGDMGAHIAELASALAEGRESLYARFFPGATPSRVAEVSASNSDRHDGGRSVHIVTFEDGRKLVYKPRRLSVDRAWNAWLRWLCDAAGLERLPTPEAVDVGAGGFCEYMAALPLEKRADAADFFFRGGFLMGAVYLLQGSDIHGENLLACGAYPVLIDVETAARAPGSLAERTLGAKTYGVIKTNFLPFLSAGPGLTPGYSALCDDDGASRNLPLLDGRALNGHSFAREVDEGFRTACDAFFKRRAEGLAVVSEAFEGCEARVIVRSTKAYAVMLKALSAPSCLKSGAAHQRMLGRLELTSAECPDREAASAVLAEEYASLRRMDIPRFSLTMGREACQRLRESMAELGARDVLRAREQTRFMLERHTARGGEQRPVVSAARDIETDALCGLAGGVTRALTGDLAVLAHRGDARYYLCLPMDSMTEGRLGACVALSAYLRVREDARAREAVEKFVAGFADQRRWAPSLQSAQAGLAEGAGGLLRGLCLLAECGAASWELAARAADEGVDLVRRSIRPSAAPCSLLYGEAGLLMALRTLPERLKTPETKRAEAAFAERVELALADCHERGLVRGLDGALLALLSGAPDDGERAKWLALAERLGPPPDGDADARFGWALLNAALITPGEKFKPGESLSTGEEFKPGEGLKHGCGEAELGENGTLAYGDAGALYALTRTRLAAGESVRDARGDEMAAKLLRPKAALPEGCERPGLFFGDAGALYAVCRYLRPDRLPGLYGEGFAPPVSPRDGLKFHGAVV